MKSMWTTLPLAAATAAALFAPTTARAGCDGTVSATALGLAASEDDKLKIALESFGIDSSLTELFRPALQTSLANSDAAAMTNQLRGLCHAFAGNAPAATPAAQAIASSGTSQPPPAARSEQRRQELKRLQCTPYLINPSGKLDRRDECDPQVGTDADRKIVADALNPGHKKEAEEKANAAAKRAFPAREDREWLPQPTKTREEIERRLAEAHQDYLKISREAETNAALKNDAEQAKLALMQSERDGRLVLPSYGLYVGPSFLLKPGGGFQEAFELSTHYDTGRFTYMSCPGFGNPPKDGACTDGERFPGGWLRGFLDLTYRSSDITDDESNDQTPDPDGYFGRDDGRVRVNLGGQWHFMNQYADALGVAAGVGFTAPIGDHDTDPANDYQRGAARWFIGLHSLTNYRVGVGELMLGYANDRYWDVRCPAATPPAVQPGYCGDFRSRYFAEGLFTLAKEDASDWSVIGRLSADIPTDSDGQADVAISVLLRRDLDAFLTGFKKD